MIGPPQPFTIWSGSQKDKGHPPQPFTIWSGHPNGQGRDTPPLASPKWTKIGPPQPFTIWSGSQMDKDRTPPNSSRLGAVAKWTGIGHPPTLHDLERFSNGQGLDPLHDLFLLPNGQGLKPPTLHDLERPPNGPGWDPRQPCTIWSSSQNGQGLDTPQPFTIWRVFLSRKLLADFLLPNSAYKMYHLH